MKHPSLIKRALLPAAFLSLIHLPSVDASQQEINRAIQQCQSGGALVLDCTCVGERFGEQRQAQGNHASFESIFRTVYSNNRCVDLDGSVEKVSKGCTMEATSKKVDPDTYCGCIREQARQRLAKDSGNQIGKNSRNFQTFMFNLYRACR